MRRARIGLPLLLLLLAAAGLLAGCALLPASHDGATPSTSPPVPITPHTGYPAPTPPHPGSGIVPPCTLDQLSISYSPTDNTAGHAHGVLTFANTGSSECELTGYATVVFGGPDGHQAMGLPSTHDAAHPTTAAVASVGGFSTADLTITRASNVQSCTVVTVTVLLVTPPGLDHERVVPIPATEACDDSDIGLLSVSANYIPPGS